MKIKTKKEKKFTWADLKKAINKIPEKHLDKEIVIWTDDERGCIVEGINVLKEDYLYDGDEGCCPRSEMKDSIEEEKREFPNDESEYYVVHEKGTRIIEAE